MKRTQSLGRSTVIEQSLDRSTFREQMSDANDQSLDRSAFREQMSDVGGQDHYLSSNIYKSNISQSNFYKSNISRILLSILSILLLANVGYGQFSGGHEAGQSVPARAEKAGIGAGPVGGNVNLFNGTLDVSYSFGTVSTLSGLSFPVTLQYNSTALLAYDAPQNSGIPYGEGWSLAEASITIDNYAYHFRDGDLPQDAQMRKIWTKGQVLKEGNIYYANPMLSLPNGISGRLVYKYPLEEDQADLVNRKLVYVLEGFSSYVEAIFDGDTWEVITEDGTRYKFGNRQLAQRNPTQHTAQLEDVLGDEIVPQVQTVKWNLGEISNPNHPQGQRILLEYKQFGKVDMFPELKQPAVAQELYYHYLKTEELILDSITVNDPFVTLLFGGQKGQIGDTLVRVLSKYKPEKIYQHQLLQKVYATDVFGVIHSQVDLKYKTWRPEAQQMTVLEIQRGKFLLLGDPETIRIDSLYSKQTVWFRGTDNIIAPLHRPTLPNTVFGSDWNRYMHPAAYQNRISNFATSISNTNPFVATYAGALGIGLNSTYSYMAFEQAGSGGDWSLDFTHSVLESERIEDAALELLPSGDLYELRSAIEVPAGVDMNFDVNLVSGLKSGTSSYVQTSSAALSGIKFRPWAPLSSNGNFFQFGSYDDKSYSIYSSFGQIAKWNPMHFGASVTHLRTVHRFHMPNLPNEFGGFRVQVGPGSDNLKYGVATGDGKSYAHRFNNLTLPGSQPQNDYRIKRSEWFGTGAPLQPLFAGDKFRINKSSNWDKGQSGDRNLYWYYPLVNGTTGNGINCVQLNISGPNQPTALTREHVGVSTSGSPIGLHTQMSACHSIPDDSKLHNLELIRISMNPWMLDSVIFSSQQGRAGIDFVNHAAYKLDYNLEQVRVLNNVNRDASQNSLTTNMDLYKKVNGNYQYRNLWQLESIHKLDCDTLGRLSGGGPLPVSRFVYYADDLNTSLIQEAYLIKDIYNQLGGKETYTYDLGLIDTVAAGGSGARGMRDPSYFVMGNGRFHQQRFTVVKREVESGNNQVQEVLYQFDNPIQMYKGYAIIDNLRESLGNPKRFWVRGYEKATVYRPSLGGINRAKTLYHYHSGLNNKVDSLRFGKLIKVEDFEENGIMISSKESFYQAHRAFRNGLNFDSTHVYLQRMNMDFNTNTQYAYDLMMFNRSVHRHREDSWFVYKTQDVSTQIDAVNGNSVSNTTDYTYFDWDENFNDTDGDYAEMYGESATPINYFQQNSWFNTLANEFNYMHEPSWQLASSTQTFSEQEGAYLKENRYYLWDAEELSKRRLTYSPNYSPQMLAYDLPHKPFHLVQQYKVRNAGYEQRQTTYNGDTNSVAHGQSTYFWYDIFEDVGADFIFETDSGSSGGGGGGPVVVDPKQLVIKYNLDTGGPTNTERISEEFLDDPRYVQDTAGVWYFFPIAGTDTISYQTYLALPELSAQLGSSSEAGYIQGLDAKVKYFGDLQLKGGGSLSATALKTACNNYGKECIYDTLTDYSQKKHILAAGLHKGCNSTLACLASGLGIDSLFPEIIQIPDTSLDDSLLALRPNFTDQLDHHFFLRDVFQQVDPVTNTRFVSGNLNAKHSIHDIFEPVLNPNNLSSNLYDYEFQPVFPVVRTYHAIARNMYGQVVEESDVRHLHQLYEYPKGKFLSWWDGQGNKQFSFSRKHLGLPLSTVQTDLDRIRHTSIFEYNPDNSLRRITGPNRDTSEFVYDDQKRLAELYANGELLESYTYSTWNGNTGLPFTSRTLENYVQASSYDGVHANPLQAYAYKDPMGRDVQSLTTVETAPGLWEKHFSGKQEWDNWNRATIGNKPYAKTNQTDPLLDSNVPITAFAEMQYESDSRGRVLKTAKPGNSITGNHVQESEYAIINLSQFVAETGIDPHDLQELYPGTPLFLQINGGNPLNKPKLNFAVVTYTFLFRTAVEDEDGKRVINYSNQLGQQMASLAYEDLTYSQASRVLTVFIAGQTGGIRRVIHPNQLETTRRFNYLGLPIEVVSPDKGLEKFMYLPDGQVKYYQDANLRVQGRYLDTEYDRMGRVYRQSRKSLGYVVLNSQKYYPLYYRDTLGVNYTSIQSMYDFPHIGQGDWNADPTLWTFALGTSQLSFPQLHFPESGIIKEKEFRFDFPQDSGSISYFGVNMATNLLPDNAKHLITKDQTHCPTRPAMSLGYDPQGYLSQVSYYSYDHDGNPKWTIRQFSQNGITVNDPGTAHAIHYNGYDRQGKLLTRDLDLRADGVLDFQQHFEYDAFGRLDKVFAGKRDLKELGTKVAEYHYDPASGQVEQLTYFAAGNGSCQTNIPIDSINYTYDTQDRLNLIESTLFDFGLYYDNQNPNTSQVGSQGGLQFFTSAYDQNFNGNINGWHASYKVQSSGVSGFDRATVYGFKYDGLNRLTDADASVREHAVPSLGSFYPNLNNFGTPLLSTTPAWQGM